MLPHLPVRTRKSLSVGFEKEDKENCNNNMAPLCQNKLVKLRESFAHCNQPEKIISSLSIDCKEKTESLAQNLKKEYSWLIKKDYSHDIICTLIDGSQNLHHALKDHLITLTLRAKMVDWMIEVLSSYKMSEEAFFRSTKYMDLFFKKSTRKLEVSELHLIGVTSMFMASKYEEIYPLKLNTIYDKICRKKFSKKEVIDMEQQILSTLEFELQLTTCYDIIRHNLGEMEIPLDPKASEYLQKVSLYLAKMSMHCPQVCWESDNKLAAAVIYIALKTVEQVESSLISDSFLEIIAKNAQIKTGEVLEMSQELLSLAKSFQKQYPSLTNLKKFNNAEYNE